MVVFNDPSGKGAQSGIEGFKNVGICEYFL